MFWSVANINFHNVVSEAKTNRFINFSTYLPENNIHCSLSFRWRFHLFMMSFLARPLPNFDAILVKEVLSVLILTIAASSSTVQAMLLFGPAGTGGLVMPDDSF